MVSFEEIEFRKQIHKKNTLRKMVKEKKILAAKLANIPSCVDEYLKLKQEISELQSQIDDL